MWNLSLSAENIPGGKKISISGSIVDKATGNPIEYASVALYNISDSSLAAGCITDMSGGFLLDNISEDMYWLEIRFMGYNTLKRDSLSVSKETKLGVLYIEQNIKTMSGVEITAERPAFEFKPDKQLLHTSSQIAASNGSAIDVLKQSPSVVVDNDDNVSLRGSGDFILLINDRMVAGRYSDVLKQIPAAQIEHIEIMTNPSARYNAAGSNGIINIRTKKIKGETLNGQLSLKAGNGRKYNGDAIIKKSYKKLDLHISGAYNNNYNRSAGKNLLEALSSESNDVISNNVDRLRRHFSANLRPEIGYRFNDNTNLYMGLTWMNFKYHGLIDTYYYNKSNGNSLYYNAHDDFLISANQVQADFAFSHKPDSNGRKLDISGSVLNWTGLNDQDTRQLYSNANKEETGLMLNRRYYEDHNMKQWDVKTDYQHPISKAITAETGLQSNYRFFWADKIMTHLDTTSHLWNTESKYSGLNGFSEGMQSAYALAKVSLSKLSMQYGMRAQYYTRLTDIPEQNLFIDYRKLYFFPSMHLSYQGPKHRQWQLSFSRRINLPNDWFTSPVPYYNDGFIIQTGNPYLKPELYSVAELNHIRFIRKHMLSLSLYTRITNDAIERTLTQTPDGKYVVSHDNLAQKYFYGFEGGTSLKLSDKLNLNVFANVFAINAHVKTNLLDYTYNQTTYNTRFNLQYRPSKKFAAELSGSYHGSQREANGTRAPLYSVNIGLRQNLLQNKLTITLSANDIFKTHTYTYTETNSNFKSTLEFKGEYPVVFLGITYKINDFKQSAGAQQQALPAMGI